MCNCRMEDKKATHVPTLWFFALGTAIAASLASFYFIEIVGNPAAPLCWIERMMMFGIVLILLVGILTRDEKLKYYILAFLLVGIPAALYQQLVHWDLIPTAIQPCSVSFVCTTKFFNLFGLITQATLCLSAFIVIGICVFLAKFSSKKPHSVLLHTRK